ncbi:MAG: hypothetical protein ABI640_01110 [Gammaproteobacteria bacterium]
MLDEFISSNRRELIARCRHKVQRRSSPVGASDANGVPLFLQQLVDTLGKEQSAPDVLDPAPTPAPTTIGRGAALHGATLLRNGYTIDQVVHDYGDVCQAVTQLASEQRVSVTVDEFRILNRCLDNAIADAVTAFAEGNELHGGDVAVMNEQRRLVSVAVTAYAALQTGKLGLGGSTGTILAATLSRLAELLGAHAET